MKSIFFFLLRIGSGKVSDSFVWLISCFFLLGCTAKIDNRQDIAETDSLSILPTLYADTTGRPFDSVCRDIPLGEPLSPEELSMHTEFDYYPLSAKEIKLEITNHSGKKYTCGVGYSLVYYDEKKVRWEPLPVSLMRNADVGDWQVKRDSGYQQQIHLLTDKVPNRAGRYRIYKSFNQDTKTAYAEFSMVDKKGVMRLRKQIDNYWSDNLQRVSDTVAANVYSTYIGASEDTIFVMLMNNTPRYQAMFRRKVVSYSAVSHGKIMPPRILESPTYADTVFVRMQTERKVYPVGAEKVSVVLKNRNSRSLFFGTDYDVARKEGDRWVILYSNPIYNSVGILVESGEDYHFEAHLNPMVNENRPGIYKVFKKIGFDGNRLDQDWFMSAEFLLDDKMQVRETDSSDSNIHAYRRPEFPGGITALNEFIAKHIRYPEEAMERGIQGRVIVQFVIDEHGKATNAEVLRSVSPELDKEALRIVGIMPKWNPGIQKGKPTKMKWSWPIAFRLPLVVRPPQGN